MDGGDGGGERSGLYRGVAQRLIGRYGLDRDSQWDHEGHDHHRGRGRGHECELSPQCCWAPGSISCAPTPRTTRR